MVHFDAECADIFKRKSCGDGEAEARALAILWEKALPEVIEKSHGVEAVALKARFSCSTGDVWWSTEGSRELVRRFTVGLVNSDEMVRYYKEKVFPLNESIPLHQLLYLYEMEHLVSNGLLPFDMKILAIVFFALDRPEKQFKQLSLSILSMWSGQLKPHSALVLTHLLPQFVYREEAVYALLIPLSVCVLSYGQESALPLLQAMVKELEYLVMNDSPLQNYVFEGISQMSQQKVLQFSVLRYTKTILPCILYTCTHSSISNMSALECLFQLTQTSPKRISASHGGKIKAVLLALEPNAKTEAILQLV